jgi:hypothetical protein
MDFLGHGHSGTEREDWRLFINVFIPLLQQKQEQII